jgi:hypothetical protein
VGSKLSFIILKENLLFFKFITLVVVVVVVLVGLES